MVSLTSKPTRVSSSLIRYPIHSALGYIEAKSFENYYRHMHIHIYTYLYPLILIHTYEQKIELASQVQITVKGIDKMEVMT